MRTFITTLILFLLFTTAFYVAALFVFPHSLKKNLKYKKDTFQNLRYAIQSIDSFSSLAILFLGSSHTYRGFDVRIFDSAGLKSLNLGSSSQAPVQTQVLVEKYLAEIKPGTVIYEVNPISFSNEGVESSLDFINNNDITMATVKMAIEVNDVRTTNTLIYGIFRQMLQLDKGFVTARSKNKDTYVSGGFVERKQEYFQRHKTYTVQTIEVKEKQLRCFKQTLQYLKEKGVKIFLVQAPVTSSLYSSYKNNNEFDSIMDHQNVPYLNFNKLIHLDDSLHFYDAHHLNQQGVRLFNLKLIEILKANYFRE